MEKLKVILGKPRKYLIKMEKPTLLQKIKIIFSKNRFDIIDLQNASLSGGVAVGAIADLMIQPFGALIAGTLTGAISTLGFRWLQVES